MRTTISKIVNPLVFFPSFILGELLFDNYKIWQWSSIFFVNDGIKYELLTNSQLN